MTEDLKRAIQGKDLEIADRKRAEKALRKSEDKFRSLSRELTIGLSDVFQALHQISSGDPSVRIPETSGLELIADLKRAVNQTAEDLSEIVDLSHEIAIGLAEHFDTLDRVTKGNLDARIKSNTGVELLESLKRVTNTMIQSVSREINQRVLAEEHLVKAKEEAEAASHAKGSFLANMSHEIRTPLNAVIGMTELTLGTELTEEQQEYLDTVRTSSESLLRLLNDILDFSKIEAGQLEMTEVDFDLQTTLDNVEHTLAMRAQEAGLELTCSIKPDVRTSLVGDPMRLGQIIVNLAANAIKFTKEGQVNVLVETEKEEDSSALLHFSVSDTGVGISPDQIETIFESFKQADDSTTREYGGTGLGLTISKQLVEMMGGRIWVESELGKGSTFHFTARFQLSDGEAIEVLHTKDFPVQKAPKQLSILLVEDNPVNQKVAATMLNKRGHSPVIASNGKEALGVLDRESVDLILMDVQMPEMDGFEATKLIREREKGNGEHIPIVAMTAHALTGDRERCLSAGMDSYISKPIRAEQLFTIIQDLVNRPQEKKKENTPASQDRARLAEDVFDLSMVMKSLDGDMALFEELANLFSSVAADNIAKLREGVAKGDPSAVEEATHTLRGSVGNFGAKRTLDAVHRLELIGKNGTWAEAEAAQLDLEREIKVLEEAMKRALAA